MDKVYFLKRLKNLDLPVDKRWRRGNEGFLNSSLNKKKRQMGSGGH